MRGCAQRKEPSASAENKKRQEQPDMATKTTAVSRVHNDIPPDQLGLPKPYDIFMPFVPSEAGANRRHFRKPPSLLSSKVTLITLAKDASYNNLWIPL